MIDWNMYCIEARKTAVYPNETARAYTLLGLNGEWQELEEAWFANPEQVEKEIGDCYWYLSSVQHEFNLGSPTDIYTEERQPTQKPSDIFADGYRSIAKLQQAHKRELRDSVEADKGNMETLMFGIMIDLARLCRLWQVSPKDILDANIAKLTARQQAGTIRGSGEGENRR